MFVQNRGLTDIPVLSGAVKSLADKKCEFLSPVNMGNE